ncbi:MAG: glycine betaine ABC transporter substrate-binding protein [Rhodospirillaceae bacterium]
MNSVVQFDVVKQNGARLTATGFLVRPGVVATNAHVVRDFADGRVIYGSPPAQAVIEEILDVWPEVDLALVSAPGIRMERAPRVRMAGADADGGLQVGDPIYVIGNPGGLTNTFGVGMLSARRQLEGFDTLQLTVSATHGSSGSPVFDRRGQVVGVVRSTAIRGTDIVLATPALLLEQMLSGRRPAQLSAPSAAPQARQQQSAVSRAASDGATIVVGVPQGVSAEATAHVLQAAIETRYPYGVMLRRGTNADILEGIARGDGSFDVHAEVWLPNQKDLWNAYVRDNGNVAVSGGYTGFQGLCINGAVTDAHGIRALSDLGNPERAALFDSNGDGKGEIWIGDPGWNAPDINRVKIRDYGLAALYTGFTEAESSYLPELERRLSENIPTVFYCYLPHWLANEHDIATLREPPYSPECYSVRNPAIDRRWLENSVARCNGPLPRIHLIYARGLERRAPGVAQFLAQTAITATEVSEWADAFRKSDAHPSRFAQTWVIRNPSFVGLAAPF